MCDRESAEEVEKLYQQRYLIEKVLGTGGMGKVFLAKDLKTGKNAAVKIVKDQSRWERERDILKILNDIQGAPRLYFAGKEKEVFLVMEYIKGDSLKQYIRKSGKLSKKEMILWMIKICTVLEKIHAKGIIHMDLKPENIILHPSGKIYLIDFGVSLFEREYLTGYGTKTYASKKQAKAGEKAICLMDIYSLGRIMELNTKDHQVRDIRNIIQKCLIEDEAQRYHTVTDIKRELQKILWLQRVIKTMVFFISLSGICFLYMTSQNNIIHQKVTDDQKRSENLKKGKLYFYGNDDTPKDLMMAKKYFLREQNEKDKAKAYLKITETLLDDQKNISDKELKKAFKICENDVNDFWSAYFFEHQYVMLAEKFPEDSLDQAERMIKKMEKFPLNEQKQKLMETDKLHLYEAAARHGNEKRFLKETDQIFYKKYRGVDAWEVYERKISYLEEHGKEVKEEFEKFIEHYPDVMDAYISYIIYLCQKNQLSKAKDIYQKGQRQTGMSSQRAQKLRRKLGL